MASGLFIGISFTLLGTAGMVVNGLAVVKTITNSRRKQV